MFMGVATHQPRNQSGCQPSDPLSLNPWIGQRAHDFLLPTAPISPPASISLRGSNTTTRMLLLRNILATAGKPLHCSIGKPTASAATKHRSRRRALNCSTTCCITTPIDANERSIAATELPASTSSQRWSPRRALHRSSDRRRRALYHNTGAAGERFIAVAELPSTEPQLW